MFTVMEPSEFRAHVFADQIDKGWKCTVERDGICTLDRAVQSTAKNLLANTKSNSSTYAPLSLRSKPNLFAKVMIARAATAQDDITGDGTTSVVLMVGELLKQADRHITEGLHPRIITDGYEIAKTETLKVCGVVFARGLWLNLDNAAVPRHIQVAKRG